MGKLAFDLIQPKRIKSNTEEGQKLLDYWIETVEATNYWRAFKSRIEDVMIVELQNGSHVCLPRSVVHGTVTRRTADSLFVIQHSFSKIFVTTVKKKVTKL